MGILHTWGRDLSYHPHLHFIVPGIAYFKEGHALVFAKENFLVPVKALSLIFKAKFRDALKKENEQLFNSIDPCIREQDWVVHSEPVGSGETAFKYLATYVFRVAISNNRILSIENGKVTFTYQNSQTKQCKLMTLEAHEFMRRFLQHVLPDGFMKVRYYGFWASANKNVLHRLKELLHVREKKQIPENKNRKSEPIRCPNCNREMRFFAELKPGAHWPHAPPEKRGLKKIMNTAANF
jgi:hypothetical protein